LSPIAAMIPDIVSGDCSHSADITAHSGLVNVAIKSISLHFYLPFTSNANYFYNIVTTIVVFMRLYVNPLVKEKETGSLPVSFDVNVIPQ
jgi:hypothetical protein